MDALIADQLAAAQADIRARLQVLKVAPPTTSKTATDVKTANVKVETELCELQKSALQLLGLEQLHQAMSGPRVLADLSKLKAVVDAIDGDDVKPRPAVRTGGSRLRVPRKPPQTHQAKPPVQTHQPF